MSNTKRLALTVPFSDTECITKQVSSLVFATLSTALLCESICWRSHTSAVSTYQCTRCRWASGCILLCKLHPVQQLRQRKTTKAKVVTK